MISKKLLSEVLKKDHNHIEQGDKMKKALKFLKDYRKSIPDHETYNDELDEATKELEEAMKPKTCEDCKGFVRNDYCHIIDDDCRVVMERCNGCKQFEPKDNA